jgi:HNH endonuclease/NUMOD4 motif-containing protein
MATETWRPIAGRAGYEVSDLGRVRSVDRVVTVMRRGRAVEARYKGVMLRLNPAGNGYLNVNLGRCRSARVHSLVLKAFVGPRPAGYQAAHADGDKLNNAVANLRWATPEENNADKSRHGTLLCGSRNHNGARTHCKWGHPFDAENTRRNHKQRICRTCERERGRRYRAARRCRSQTAVIAAKQSPRGRQLTPAPAAGSAPSFASLAPL